MLSCPEKSAPGETASAVSSIEATSSAEPGQTSAIREESQMVHTTTMETEGQIDSTTTNIEASGINLELMAETDNQSGIFPSVASSTFDSVPSTTVASIPRINELAEEPNTEELVQASVTKKKGKFYASDINFPWELPYLKCERPARAHVRKVKSRIGRKYEAERCESNGEKYEIGFWVRVALL